MSIAFIYRKLFSLKQHAPLHAMGSRLIGLGFMVALTAAGGQVQRWLKPLSFVWCYDAHKMAEQFIMHFLECSATRVDYWAKTKLPWFKQRKRKTRNRIGEWMFLLTETRGKTDGDEMGEIWKSYFHSSIDMSSSWKLVVSDCNEESKILNKSWYSMIFQKKFHIVFMFCSTK